MSIVTVQLGQCGNQIGHEVFSALCRDIRGTHGLCSKEENESYQESSKERFFSQEEFGGTALKGFFFPPLSTQKHQMVCVVTDLCSLQFRFGFGTINGSAEIRAWPGPFCVVPLIVWLKWVGGITSDPSKPIHPTQIISTFSPILFPFLCSSCCPGRAR